MIVTCKLLTEHIPTWIQEWPDLKLPQPDYNPQIIYLNRSWPKPVLICQNPNLTWLVTNLTWIQPDPVLTRPEFNPICYKPDPKSTQLVIDLTRILPELLLTRPKNSTQSVTNPIRNQHDLLLTRPKFNPNCSWPDFKSP